MAHGVQVSNHPVCGPLLVNCDNGTRNDPEPACHWHGLTPGKFTIRFSYYPSPVEAAAHLINGTLYASKDNCPLPVRPDVYEQVVSEMAIDRGIPMDLMDPEPGLGRPNYRFLRNSKLAYALLISHLHVNTSAVLDPKPLVDLGLMRGPQPDTFDACRGVRTSYTGEITEENVQRNTWPGWQLTASGLIIAWGMLLLYVSYPSRRLVIHGTVDQWMSFGSDLGKEHMAGASSGHCAAASTAMWRLRVDDEGDGTGRIRLVQVDASDDDSVRVPKVRYGMRYV
ncbi:hypothetical protein H2201_007265 [Coniosporium apollinis]|uniref:Uncharacterized protein n=1 Tax=Coniosporium apollinis TaxID=61459 RepID=A0ABQ9NM08_9PEZI|nr:hypothetical protein H2201_007265 [Coniosporium apollinis]